MVKENQSVFDVNTCFETRPLIFHAVLVFFVIVISMQTLIGH